MAPSLCATGLGSRLFHLRGCAAWSDGEIRSDEARLVKIGLFSSRCLTIRLLVGVGCGVVVLDVLHVFWLAKPLTRPAGVGCR